MEEYNFWAGNDIMIQLYLFATEWIADIILREILSEIPSFHEIGVSNLGEGSNLMISFPKNFPLIYFESQAVIVN